ncbi:acyl-CoA N-acyltransferase [Backusella circina FSU 941]|nr:acyl-CoA N-acyltransferase [Backusella circina FSU 941]
MTDALHELKKNCPDYLDGKHIRLQRLNPERDYQELYDASHGTPAKSAVWKYFNADAYKRPFETPELFKETLDACENDPTWLQFVVIDKKSNKKVGQMNFLNTVPYHQRSELGGIWYAVPYHGGYANPESTLLILTYLFEHMKYRRAEWKTDSNNIASQKAAVKLGFTFEGRFRQHMFAHGVNRDTMYYSMLDHEWDEKKKLLFERLGYTQQDIDHLNDI